MKELLKHRWLHVGLLCLWIGLGTILRFTNLASKPLWTDEFATIVFSLGHSFRSLLFDQPLTVTQLLSPLQPDPQAGVVEVVKHLLKESNHPPLYFVLTHFWLKFFPAPEGWVSIWAVRSLSTLFGVVAIPAMYGFGWLAFRSRVVAHLSALLMATSPFGIYLAQEARHYTLPVLWIIASLCCLIVAARAIRDRTPLPIWIGWVWVIVNGLGIATHYFMAFTLAAEAFVVASLGLAQSWHERGIWHPSSHWKRLWMVAAGTLASGLVWLPLLPEIPDSELTRWIYRDWTLLNWFDPIFQAIAGWTTLLYLLPIQAESALLVTCSQISLVILLLWTLPKLYWGLQVQLVLRDPRLSVYALGGFVVGAIGIFLAVTYLFGIDLTSAFRYNFVYFPAVIVLIAASLSSGWDIATRISSSSAPAVPQAFLGVLRTNNRKIIILVVLLSFLGSLTVVNNLGYQKTHRPDLVARTIREASLGKTVIAIPYRSHGQTGRLMGIAWEFQHPRKPSQAPMEAQFLLTHRSENSASIVSSLRQAMMELSRPLELWLINFQDVSERALNRVLQQESCLPKDNPESVDGYRYQQYRCRRT